MLADGSYLYRGSEGALRLVQRTLDLEVRCNGRVLIETHHVLETHHEGVGRTRQRFGLLQEPMAADDDWRDAVSRGVARQLGVHAVAEGGAAGAGGGAAAVTNGVAGGVAGGGASCYEIVEGSYNLESAVEAVAGLAQLNCERTRLTATVLLDHDVLQAAAVRACRPPAAP